MPDEREVGAAILIELGKVPGLSERFGFVRTGRRRPGTRESKDRQLRFGSYPGTLASLKIAIAVDHLNALHAAIGVGGPRPTIPTWAHYSLLRGAIEASADAMWLLEREVSDRTRVRRALNRLIYDYGERATAEDDLPEIRMSPRAGYKRAAKLQEKFRQEAEEAGLKPVGYPGTVQLLKGFRLCDGFDAYHFRFLSGVLHSLGWAGLQGEHKETKSIDGETSRVRQETNLVMTWHITRCAVRYCLAAIASLEAYLGA